MTMKRAWPFSQILLFCSIAVATAAVVFTIFITNTTLRSIEKNLPGTLFHELASLDLVLEQISELVIAAEVAAASTTPRNVDHLKKELHLATESINAMRQTFVFDNLIQASAFHAVVAPAVSDLQIWLSEGISGYDPMNNTTIRIALSRIASTFQKAKNLNRKSRLQAENELEQGRKRLDQFLFNVNLLLILTLIITVFMIVLFVRQHLFKSREIEAQKALQASEQKYRAVVENTPDLLYRTDLNGVITFISSSVYTLSGFTVTEAIGMKMAEEVYSVPEERQMFLDELRKHGVVKNFQARLKRKDGSFWWAATNAHFFKDEDGSVIGVEGITRDITELKQAEEALQLSLSILDSSLESTADGILVVDRNGRVSKANRKFLELWRIPAEMAQEGEDDRFLEYVVDQLVQPQEFLKKIKELYANPEKTSFDQLELSDGRFFERNSQPQRLGDEIVGRVWSFSDITERKRAEIALKESEAKYRKVVENAIEAICVIQDGFFKYYNPEAVKLFGYPAEELDRLPTDEIIHPEDMDLVNSIRLRRQGGEHVIEYSHRIVRKDKNILWIDIKAVSITWENQPALLVFLRDITEQKRTGELMIQTEKMMSLGGLAAGVAHELNNPLGGMLQGVQNVQRRLSSELNSNIKIAKESGIDLQKLQSYLEKRDILNMLDGIRDSGKKAAQIITNMLQFSRKSESNLAPVNLANLIENTLELASKDYDLKKKYDFRSIETVKEFDSDLPPVPCNETEIQQVILNLLANAAWAMSNQKTDEPPKIILRLKKVGETAQIEVEDNGPGMNETERKKIFEPFFTTKPVGEGTGLGLSVSYMIITNNHKGTIEVDSNLGKGTKFVVQLPMGSGL